MNSDWPIIIGGSHRSGTTLLRRLLDGSTGENVRIDPFSVLSAKRIEIGSYVNVSTLSALLGRAKVSLRDFSSTRRGRSF